MLLAACGPPAPAHRTPTLQHIKTSPRLTWIVSATALSAMARPSQLTRWFAGDQVLELVSAGGHLVVGVPAKLTLSVGSYQAASAALIGTDLELGALIYDQEHWQFTPLPEQENPFAAEQQVVAQAAVSRPHVVIVLAPALDLTRVLQTSPGATAADAYLQLGIAANAGRALAGGQVSGLVDVQAQSLELDPRSYAAFVRAAAAQIHSVAPNLPVLAGLSTSPSVGLPTLEQLLTDVRDTAGQVAGYWLNVPRPGAHCPGCGAYDPELAASLLAALAHPR
jgi:hypothetical protein